MFKDKIQVSEEDAKKYFEENKEFYEGKTYEEVKDQLIQQLSDEKLSGEFSTWLTDTKSKSSIKYFVSF